MLLYENEELVDQTVKCYSKPGCQVVRIRKSALFELFKFDESVFRTALYCNRIASILRSNEVFNSVPDDIFNSLVTSCRIQRI